MSQKLDKNLPQGKGEEEVFPFSDSSPDSVVRVFNSLASVEAIVKDREGEWKLFIESDTGKYGEREKTLTKALIDLFGK